MLPDVVIEKVVGLSNMIVNTPSYPSDETPAIKTCSPDFKPCGDIVVIVAVVPLEVADSIAVATCVNNPVVPRAIKYSGS